MKKHRYCTSLRAVDPADGELKSWAGPDILASSFAEAQSICSKSGYLTLDGLLLKTIPCKGNGWEPDWDNAIEHLHDGHDSDYSHSPAATGIPPGA